jgi:hypothetical protein
VTLLASGAEQPDAYAEAGEPEKGIEESLRESLTHSAVATLTHSGIMAKVPPSGKGDGSAAAW